MNRAAPMHAEKPLKEFYLLVQPWAVYVKEASFFEAQGGTRSLLGKGWKVSAPSIDAAREIGEKSRKADVEAKLAAAARLQEYSTDAVLAR